MQRYKLTLEYDGTPFSGWQKQADLLTVQGVVETACSTFADGPTEVQCSGRTDAGVHALGQVVHVDFPVSRTPLHIIRGLNILMLPHPIVVREAEAVQPEFHARFDSKQRVYRYQIINRLPRLSLDEKRAWHVSKPLDVEAMREGAKYLIGHHDFSSFRSSECQSNSPMRTLDRLSITREGDGITIETAARSFLHHQVRNMVGTLVLVGQGKWQPSDVKSALEARDRRASGPNAPAHGLYFLRVEY